MGSSEILVAVPGAQLHKVEDNVQVLLVEGEFTVAIVGTVAAAIPSSAVDPNNLRVEAAVTSKTGHVAFPLGKHLPALKAAATIYSFALENTQDAYFCLILPSDTPADVLDAVHDVLHNSCAFSTAKQVDAAYEEADKLNGSKEAAALEAADVAGATPATAAPAGATSAVAASVTGQAAAPGVVPGKQTTADKLAAGLVWGGAAVASAVGQAAAATASAIQGYAQKQIATSQPNHKPATISPTFKKGLALAGTVASSAAYVTGKLAALVGQASYATALAIAKALPGHKKKKKPGEIVSQEERSALHKVGAAGLVAFVDVYDSLENAARVVLTHSADATTQYIEYKYGPEAGDAAKTSVPVATDMLSATMNFSRLGARAFISKTAKKSAKIYLKSTVAGVPLHEQQPGVCKASAKFAVAPMVVDAQRQPGAIAAAPGVAYPGVAADAMDVQRIGSSSNYLANPYPVGTSAATAASGGVAVSNTAAAQQALRAGKP